MSREIKFRAWSKKEKVMTTCWNLHQIPVAILAEQLDCEVMQFTGLCDKNGKEIYEGDVLRVTNKPDWPSAVSSVRFENGGFVIDMDSEPTWLDDCINIFIGEGWNYEIIGNVHENPELVK